MTPKKGYSQRLRQKFWNIVIFQGFYYCRKFSELNPGMLKDNITFPLSGTEKATRWRNYIIPDFRVKMIKLKNEVKIVLI